MTPKERAISIMKQAVTNAEDDLFRTKSTFAGYTEKQMQESFFSSGVTHKRILESSQRAYDETIAAFNLVKELLGE